MINDGCAGNMPGMNRDQNMVNDNAGTYVLFGGITGSEDHGASYLNKKASHRRTACPSLSVEHDCD